ncbi:MAG: VapE domain-containing protein [Spirochaetales bacterium]
MNAAYGVTVRYNMMSHKVETVVPGVSGEGQVENASLGELESVCSLNKFPVTRLQPLLLPIAQKNRYHPVRDWITSLTWDGVSRISALASTLVTPSDFDERFKEVLVRRWVISAVAAVMAQVYRGRGVLTLQGKQGIGKTKWFTSLVPSLDWIIAGQVVDPRIKDTLEQATMHWVVELGELEGLLRKADIAMLKAFLTQEVDTIRYPYLRRSEKYPRRTVYAATVNEAAFLTDTTGSSRFWVIPVVAVKPMVLPLEQVWAEARVLYENGENWWLSPDEEALLSASNENYQELEEFEEQVLDWYDPLQVDRPLRMTTTDVLVSLEISNPTKAQLNKMGKVLHKHFPMKLTSGRKTFALPKPELKLDRR